MIEKRFDELTQGSMISGVRSVKYPGINCYGIIITARCDIANKKVEKFYYLIAIPVEEWILSKVGFDCCFNFKKESIADVLNRELAKFELVWDDIKSFSIEEFTKVINDTNSIKMGEIDKLTKKFIQYKQYCSEGLNREEKIAIFKQALDKENRLKGIDDILKQKNTHFTYVPQSAYNDTDDMSTGIIIDHQELDYFSFIEMKHICSYQMDSKSMMLSETEKERYDLKVFLFNEPGYAVIEKTIRSPWVEYLLQRFTNSFVRIGVDGPVDQTIINIYKKIIEGK